VSRNGTADLRRRKIGDLLGLLSEEAKTLVRQEVELAKAELNERVEVLRTDLARDIGDAKEQLSTNSSRLAAGAGLLAGAGVFALVTLGVAAAGLVRVLDHAMSLGAALAVTLLVFLLITAVLALIGRNRLRRATPLVQPWTANQIRADAQRAIGGNPVPETVETVKEDVEWLKHPTRSGQR
jgi:hypothetical protein